jgi:hypothetical protein
MINMRVKSWSFNDERVLKAVARAREWKMAQAGAFIRQASKTSIRKRKKISEPGHPPSSHEGTLRQRIVFGYDKHADSVVIGPTPTNQIFFNHDCRPVTGTVPSVLEYGGSITIWEVFKYGEWSRADLRSHRNLAGYKMRYRKVRISARPFMRPAFEEEMPKLEKLWANSVGG